MISKKDINYHMFQEQSKFSDVQIKQQDANLKISVEFDYSNYAEKQDYTTIKSTKSFKSTHKKKDETIELKVSIVDLIDNIITDFLKEVFDKNKTLINVQEKENRFALQVQGLQDYLFGNRQFYHSESVRLLLRKNKSIKLKLVEIPLNQYKENPFPQIIERQLDDFIPLRKDIPDINWDDYRETRFLLWQKPVRPKKITQFINSNDIEFPFQVQILNIESLYLLFHNIDPTRINDKNNAINNGFNTPQFITYKKKKKQAFEPWTRTEELIEQVMFYPHQIQLKIKLLVGNNKIYQEFQSNIVSFKNDIQFFQNINLLNEAASHLLISQLHSNARLCINIVAISQNQEKKQIIGCGVINVFDHRGILKQGFQQINIWPFYIYEERLVAMKNYEGFFQSCQKKQQTVLNLKFPTFQNQIKHSLPYVQQKEIYPTNDELAQVQPLLNTDPLNWANFKQSDKNLIKKCKSYFISIAKGLQVYLHCIDYHDPQQIAELDTVILSWGKLNPEQVLPLLDAYFADIQIRSYAIQKLNELPDDMIELYMLQFTEALKNETFIQSPLSDFLLERSLKNLKQVGHAFFWQLKSQLHIKPTYERFYLILQQFMYLCGDYLDQLLQENKFTEDMVEISNIVNSKEGKMERINTLKDILGEYSFNKNQVIALDNKVVVSSCIIDSCKVYSSKKAPLQLKLQNKFEKDLKNYIIFKCGDDIRQDQLTLQLISIIDRIWLQHEQDLHMIPYRVLATADMVGLIELVQDSQTLSDIHNEFSKGIFQHDTLKQYLKRENPQELYKEAEDNFLKSCAGYCVATYILGVGDRHSGNIMMQSNGNLFHIDFGHFLGHFKSKFGFNRERSKFVFTKEQAFIFGRTDSTMFKDFESQCYTAYNLVRKHGNFLISLLMLCLSAGIPELETNYDINYMKQQLHLNLTDQEATNVFRKELQIAMDNTYKLIDDWIHDNKHKDKKEK